MALQGKILTASFDPNALPVAGWQSLRWFMAVIRQACNIE